MQNVGMVKSPQAHASSHVPLHIHAKDQQHEQRFQGPDAMLQDLYSKRAVHLWCMHACPRHSSLAYKKVQMLGRQLGVTCTR